MRKIQHHKWTKEEKAVVYTNFRKHIHLKKLTGKSEIETVLKKEPVLKSRTWTKVKDFVRNESLKV